MFSQFLCILFPYKLNLCDFETVNPLFVVLSVNVLSIKLIGKKKPDWTYKNATSTRDADWKAASNKVLFPQCREKPPSMTDEDFHCSLTCDGNAHGSSHPSAATPGVTFPLYVATPFDHDYAKRKTLRRQQQQQWAQQQQHQRRRHEERQADGTVLESVPLGVALFALSALGQQAHWGAL